MQNSEQVVFLADKYIYLYDKKNRKLRKIIDADYNSYFAFLEKDKNFFYNTNSERGKVYKFNMNTNETKFMFNGFSPIISDDEQYMADIKDKNERILVIRNLRTGKEIEYDFGWIRNYSFSPENNKIVVQCENNKSYEIMVWDFINDKTKVVIDNAPYVNSFDWK